MPRKKKQPARQEKIKKEILFEIYGLILLALSFIALASYGAIGRNLTYLSRFIVGSWDFIIPLCAMAVAIFVMIRRKWPTGWSPRLTGVLNILIAMLVLNHYFTIKKLEANGLTRTDSVFAVVDTTWEILLKERTTEAAQDVGGGMIGAIIYDLAHFLFDDVGTMIVILVLVLTGILLITGFSYVWLFQRMKKWLNMQKKSAKNWMATLLQKKYLGISSKSPKKALHKKKPVPFPDLKDNVLEDDPPTISDFQDEFLPENKEVSQPEQLSLPLDPQPVSAKNPSVMEEKKEEKVEVEAQTEMDMKNYRLPSYSLLQKMKKGNSGDRQDLSANAQLLENTLASFGVEAKVIHIHRGPTVTRYEIQPQVGVKVSRIVNLSDDLALALAAKDIRIEAPIPGKSAIGIEVPNPEIAVVGLRDVLESAQFDKWPQLSISIGKDITGKPVIGNLAKMPHLLVAGATGSGKSVCINGIILSLLYKAKPNEVKLMMIDPKMVELNIYNGIPHLLAPVVTDSRKAAIALKKVVTEMERRYELFAKSGAREIERYNQLMEDPKDRLPYIVVIIDELADLMMVAPADVEDAICRLAQMARAAGIHLIIATQRPSVDVITGIIKANIPSRIAFAVSSQADSRTILDMGGAEKLLGRGDMLYLPTGASKPIRVQGAYVSDEEVESVVQFVKDQQDPVYDEKMIPSSEAQPVQEVTDELYPQAVQVVVEAKMASVSLLQRRLRIGYARAARLIDMMESNGIVGPYEGSKPREVFMKKEQLHENK
ncbi:FtsK/SpoIIIE family DNA translocase [Thermoflavimicrobium dichotomicum]|uniref:DNA segregation ATPase FtsK/SpoIIIE, S-DNA-T family n=1 Tax=Thermoflavimicrobium dichotomicum TaxID=46223 RepID=A0A1I3PSB2_9BACL|nr:DNA translocase FtsK [Thermoflavimicrobium dichotomicum]SFJ24305.1 DNA segregation ATPase FtsK/SpoIIIE, S-DNA-T family [Thermoflavimicrobium dichotomicum]